MPVSLVTGGAGFIGSNLVRKLIQLGHKIIIIDDLSTGFERNFPEKKKDFVFYKKDITSDLYSIFKKHKIDYVFHLAAQIDIRKSIQDSVYNDRVNVLGSLNLMEHCSKAGVKRFIYASTGGFMYGDPSKIPVKESHAVDPVSPYGISKYRVEKYLDVYRKLYDFNYITLRYGNVYGPFQNPKGEAGVVAIFINQLLERKKPTLYDYGRQKRDYVYIDDAVGATVNAMESDKIGVYHVGTGIATTTSQIFDSIRNELRTNIKPLLKPARFGEIKQIALDSRKIKKDLNWNVDHQLSEGIRKTIDWFKKR